MYEAVFWIRIRLIQIKLFFRILVQPLAEHRSYPDTDQDLLWQSLFNKVDTFSKVGQVTFLVFMYEAVFRIRICWIQIQVFCLILLNKDQIWVQTKIYYDKICF